MRIAFLMDRLETIDPIYETTSALMYECNERGHEVYFLEPHDLYIRTEKVVARMRNVTVPRHLSIKKYWRAAINCLKKDELIFESLTEIDALFLRKNPPLNYQALEFLAPANEQVFIINSTSGQIQGNSKLYTLNFPDIIPETHVSRDPARLKKIIENFGGAMVIKPLQRFGGEGVIKVSTRDRENLTSLINYYVRAYRPYPDREAIMVQEYLKEVKTEGDVRVLMLDGEILGAMRRVPPEDQIRANIHAGARAYKHELTTAQRDICVAISGHLKKDGLYFVGVDIISDKLVEVNCVSPGGIPRINRFDQVRLEEQVVDFIERTVAARKRKQKIKRPAI